MFRYTVYVPFDQIEKIQIYPAKGKYTAASLRKAIGCDYIINGGLYTMSSMRPNCKLKIDGTIYSNDQWSYESPAWNNPPTNFSFDTIPGNFNISKKNCITAMTLKYRGKRYDWSIQSADNNPAIGYSTKRSAMGIKNSQLALYVGSDNMIPSQLYNYLNSQGWSDILMMDGGGSTQGYLGSGKSVTSSRKVHNYICVFLKKKTTTPSTPEKEEEDEAEKNNYDVSKNPYPVPTRNIKYYTTGNDVRWVQYMLNCHDITVDIDGSYGPASQSAVYEFQADHGLPSTGIVDAATRNMMKKNHPDDLKENQEQINPYPKPTRYAIQYYTTGEDVKWVQFQLKKAGFYKNDSIDGSYGPGTVQAIKDFQKAKGLEVDGSCGPATQAALAKI